MQIRTAQVADAEQIERIRIRGWQVGYRHAFPPEELDKLTVDAWRWLQGLKEGFPNGQSCAVAEDGRELLGWVTWGPSLLPEGWGEIRGLYVDPDRWGRGAGRALLAHGERDLRRISDEAMLWTLADNPRTRRFYEAAGWSVDGTTSSFDQFGVNAPIVRYRKRLTSSTSRS
ncbi:MAG TPA: GNAT family N-acetyltransferase [Gaiellaceae bacterium]|jgi:GNAT superfamily N-acetyltransferase